MGSALHGETAGLAKGGLGLMGCAGKLSTGGRDKRIRGLGDGLLDKVGECAG